MVILDLLTKIIVVATVDPDEPVRVLGGLVYLSLIRNSGAAFSMATGIPGCWPWWRSASSS